MISLFSLTCIYMILGLTIWNSREASLGTTKSLVAYSSLSVDSVRFPALHISMTAGIAIFGSFLGSHIVEVSWV